MNTTNNILKEKGSTAKEIYKVIRKNQVSHGKQNGMMLSKKMRTSSTAKFDNFKQNFSLQ